MSHVKLVVLIDTDKDDFATRRESDGPLELLAQVMRDTVLPRVAAGSNYGPVYDTNGNKSGTYDVSEVRD